MADPHSIVSQLSLSADEEYQLHLERGRRALNAGNLIEAKAEIDRCLSARPDDSGALNLRGLLLFKLEEYDDAIRIFDNLAERFPTEHVLLTSLGLAWLKKEAFETATPFFEKAIAIDRNYDRAHNYLGFCYQNMGRYKDARDEFLLGGSRSMAAKMEELIAQEEGEAAEKKKADENVQAVIDDMINAPEPEKPTFDTVEKPVAADEQAAAPRRQTVVRNLKDLAARNRLSFSGDSACALSDDGVLRVRGQGFARLRDTAGYVGNLEFRPRFKRYKGKDLKTPFGSENDPIHELVGEGVVYLRPAGNLTVIPVDDEVIYLQEDMVWAFAGDLRWENGRLPGENGVDLLLVQFKGSGDIALRLGHGLRMLPVSPEQPALFPAASVIGWYGEVVPRLTAVPFPGHDDPIAVVEIKGQGQILFDMPIGGDRPEQE